ncbi:MAG: hypothetical protein H5T97_08260, partial [Firmicutes bacterium]|nr:hypothetical protein [Bacillota bacterium]
MGQDAAPAETRAVWLRCGAVLLAVLAGLALLAVWRPAPVRAVGSEPVTVCLAEGIPAVTLSANGPRELRDGDTGRTVAVLEPGGNLTVRFADGLEVVAEAGGPLPRRFSRLVLGPQPPRRAATASGVAEVPDRGAPLGITGTGEVRPLPEGPLSVLAADGQHTWWAPPVPLVTVGTGETQRRYRGEVVLQATPDGILVLNRLP